MRSIKLFFYLGLLVSTVVLFIGLRHAAPFAVTASVNADVLRGDAEDWKPVQAGELIYSGDRVRTGSEGRLALSPSDDLGIELLSRSVARVESPGRLSGKPEYRIKLLEGALLSAANRKFRDDFSLKILAQNAELSAGESAFALTSHSSSRRESLYVLSGHVDVRPTQPGHFTDRSVSSLEKLKIRKLGDPVKEVLSESEWRTYFGAYRLKPRPKGFQNFQQILSKFSGDFYSRVKEHGDFYTEGQGLLQRRFYWDAHERQMMLEVTYDVFPSEAFVGVYFLLEPTDLSDYQELTFEIKAREDASPDFIYMEFRDGLRAKRSYTIQNISGSWQTLHVPVHVPREGMVNEMVIYFSHATAIRHPQGAFLMRRFKLVKKEESP